MGSWGRAAWCALDIREALCRCSATRRRQIPPCDRAGINMVRMETHQERKTSPQHPGQLEARGVFDDCRTKKAWKEREQMSATAAPGPNAQCPLASLCHRHRSSALLPRAVSLRRAPGQKEPCGDAWLPPDPRTPIIDRRFPLSTSRAPGQSEAHCTGNTSHNVCGKCVSEQS